MTTSDPIADILVDEGYIAKYDIVEDGNFKTIRITLKYVQIRMRRSSQDLRESQNRVFVYTQARMSFQEYLAV